MNHASGYAYATPKSSSAGRNYFFILIATISGVSSLLMMLSFHFDGRTRLALVSAACSGCVTLIYFLWEQKKISIVSPLLISALSLFQLVALFLIAVSLPTRILLVDGPSPDLVDYPYRICLSELIGPAAVGVLGLLASKWPNLRGFKAYHRSFNVNMVLALTVPLVASRIFKIFLEVVGSGAIGYVVRVLSAPVDGIAAILGYLSIAAPRLNRILFPLLMLNALLLLLMGDRNGFNLLALYFIGRLVRTSRQTIFRRALLYAAAAILALYVSGIVGIVRDTTGRDTLSLLSPENIGLTWRVASMTVFAGTDEINMNGIGRIFMWTDAVVVAETPDVVPYRGWQDIGDELRAEFQLRGVNSDAHDARLDYVASGVGTMHATAYGFLVNDSTSVEYGWLSDGWSRGGAPGAFGYAFVLIAMAAVLECGILRFSWLTVESRLVLFGVLISIVVNMQTVPISSTFKNVVLNAMLFSATLALISTSVRILQRVST